MSKVSKSLKPICIFVFMFCSNSAFAQTHPSGLTEAQARKAVVPFASQATDCIANFMISHPQIDNLYANGNYFNILFTPAVNSCNPQISILRNALDVNYYKGHGNEFLTGAYLNDLPRAVEKRVAPVMQQRIAAKRNQENYAKQLESEAEQKTKEKNKIRWACLNENIAKTYTQSQETAKSIASAAISNCNSEMNGFYTAFFLEPKLSSLSQADKIDVRNKLTESTAEELAASVIQIRAIDANASNSKKTEKVESGGYSGSAFVINSQGHVVTNHHVIEKCAPPISTTLGEAKIVAEDKSNDIAILKIENLKSANYAYFRSSNLNMGEEVYALGFPLSGILNNGLNITDGKISSLSGINNNTNYLQMTAPIQPGNSGGPLLDASGQIVGMVSAKLDDLNTLQKAGSLPQNINYALRNDVMTGILKNKDIPFNTANRYWTKDATGIAKSAKEFTIQIICSAAKK